MKIATISFELDGNKMKLSSSKRIEKILETLRDQEPDLLVTSGYSLDDNNDLKHLQSELKEIDNKGWILVEVKNDDLVLRNGHPLNLKHPLLPLTTSSHNLYVITDKNEILNLGPQYFAQRKDVDGKANKYRVMEFEDILINRQFNINGKKVIVLCCGEINAIQGRDNIEYLTVKVKRYLEMSDIILNPTHDCMANYGTLKAKRKFLSKREGKNALYISSSNWNTAKVRNDGRVIRQNPKNSFMQNLYFNGEKIKMNEIITSEYLLHFSDINIGL